jgi:hypothetical protein
MMQLLAIYAGCFFFYGRISLDLVTHIFLSFDRHTQNGGSVSSFSFFPGRKKKKKKTFSQRFRQT